MKTLSLWLGLSMLACGAGAAPVAQSASDPSNPQAEAGASPLGQVHAEAHPPATGPAHVHEHGAASAADGAKYSCPHHPEVVSDKPGVCPKCKMDLVPQGA